VLLGQCRLHSLDVSRPRSSGKDQTWKLTWIDTSGGCCSTTNNNRFTRYFHWCFLFKPEMTNLITIYSFRYSCNNVFDNYFYSLFWLPLKASNLSVNDGSVMEQKSICINFGPFLVDWCLF
jgi:hypothetical protein